jgi:hypothetical protein
MALTKTPISMNFGKGLDTKTDKNQVALGNMLELENAVFNKGGLLTKRKGFDQLPSLSDATAKYVTTHNSNLVALGDSLQTYSDNTLNWTTKGSFQDVKLETDILVRNTSSQLNVDTAVAVNGAACSVYLDADGFSYYALSDAETGEVIQSGIKLETGALFARVGVVGTNFIIVYVIGTLLKFIAVPIYDVASPTIPDSLQSDIKLTSQAFDIAIYNNILYYAYHSNVGGDALRVGSINGALLPGVTRTKLAVVPSIISICVDQDLNQVWISYWSSTNKISYSVLSNLDLGALGAATQILPALPVNHLTSASSAGICQNFFQITNTYSFSSVRSDYITKVTINNTLVASTPTTIRLGVGLQSKAFSIQGAVYLNINYGGSFQPSYFTINANGEIVCKLASGNGISYALNQVLPQGNVNGTSVSFGYLLKTTLAPVNKNVSASSASGVYSQVGINLALITLNSGNITTTEIGTNLRITGGLPWLYDGNLPVEDGFFIWPEDITATITGAGAGLSAQTYFYQVTYEWTDGNSNIQRSAPSVPLKVIVGATSIVTLNIPTLRLTYKENPNNVRIVVYRWSTAQQIFYQVTSVPTPIANDPDINSVSYVDSAPDAQIIGNLILYTTGGVIENIQAPASTASTLYKSRMFLVDAENPNLLWYSKQVIQNTSVDMSDLQTIFVPPTTGAQGSTGPITALSVLDDKLIIFKRNAIYYLVGTGPDATGANNDFSDVVFISSTIGCANPDSIVFSPLGLMFQSDKGIWLLGRDLNTQYIGAAVEQYNADAVIASLNILGTNQVRFSLASGVTLMYDYFFQQWATFNNIPNLSGTLYKDKHTFINKYGEVYTESATSYQDGGKPVLMRFKTGWVKLAELQGYQRFYFMYMLATYVTPHTLHFGLAYDYNPSITQDLVINPDNFAGYYGNDPLFGNESPYGGDTTGNVEQWRMFPTQQTCQSFQITMQEYYDSSLGAPPGEGLTISGLNLVVGVKKGYTTLKPSNSVG